MKILFVDDDTTVCDLMSTFCHSLGIEYEVATSAQAALDRVQEEEFALCITDLMMPGMDGLTLASRLKDAFPEMGMFAFTGESGIFPIKDLEKTFDHIYFKPTEYSRLIADSMKFLATKRYPFLA
ncbi:MAG: response regulator [Planctomycetes bacterium]|nr:response regulator [Planctomycetota bacterium]